jgi:general stress protein YciG
MNTKGKQGLASLSPERRREIAVKGGSSVPPEKRSFYTDREFARSAGRRGGIVSQQRAKERKSTNEPPQVA